jgi:uncharacterized membrane protein (DUF4010 family)
MAPIPLDTTVATDLLVAALVGLAVGVEREWSGHTTGPDGRFAGARTFTLLGTIGGFAGWLIGAHQVIPAALLLAAGVLFPVVAYAAAMRRPGTTADGTTEVVAVLVVAIGAAAGLGHRALASATAALTVLLLAEKSTVQAALQRVAANEMRAALQFAVLALVVLPLLPDVDSGPYAAFNPRSLWIVVLLFSALNFAGYIARRVVGETRGLGVTGLLGGLVSSTAVALVFSRRSRTEPALGPALALGVVAACTVLAARLLVITALLQPRVAIAALPVLLPVLGMGLLVIGNAFWLDRAARNGSRTLPAVDAVDPESVTAPSPAPSAPLGTNPLGLASALQMAVAFQLVLFGVAWMNAHVGTSGVLASATILGLTDMDALTVSMTRYGAVDGQAATAAAAIGVGVLANTALKGSLCALIGTGGFRPRAVTGLALLAIGSGIGLWIGWP